MVNIKLVDKLYKIAMVQDGIESERDIIHAFAELIVKECVQFTDSDIRKFILKHFGVEE